MTISALLLEAMGAVLLFVAFAMFAGILITRTIRSFKSKADSITQHRVMQVYFWALVVATIALGLKAFSAMLSLDLWWSMLYIALTYGLGHWARIEWRKGKKATMPFDSTLQEYYNLLRSGQMDVEEEWDKESMSSSDNPSYP